MGSFSKTFLVISVIGFVATCNHGCAESSYTAKHNEDVVIDSSNDLTSLNSLKATNEPYMVILSASAGFLDATVTGKFAVEKNCLILVTASNKKYTPIFQPFHQVEYHFASPDYLMIQKERVDLNKWVLIPGGALDFYDTVFLDKGLMDSRPPEQCPKVGYPLGYLEGLSHDE